MPELDDIVLYSRWLRGIGTERPSYVGKHLIAKFLGVRVWELKYVPIHYIEEAGVILKARYEAQLEVAKRNKCTPEKIILPDY